MTFGVWRTTLLAQHQRFDFADSFITCWLLQSCGKGWRNRVIPTRFFCVVQINNLKAGLLRELKSCTRNFIISRAATARQFITCHRINPRALFFGQTIVGVIVHQ